MDVKIIVYALAESVSARLRENNFKCRVVEISIRDSDLLSFSRQKKISMPTNLTTEIAEAAMQLFKENYHFEKPIRSVGVRACDLIDANCPVQLNLFAADENRRERIHRMDMTVDLIRKRYGFESIQRGMMYQDRLLSKINAKEEHTVHPHGYFENGNRTGIDGKVKE
jgi:DNA polymerase-4